MITPHEVPNCGSHLLVAPMGRPCDRRRVNTELRVRAAYPIPLALGALDAAGYNLIAPTLPTIAGRTGAGPAVGKRVCFTGENTTESV